MLQVCSLYYYTKPMIDIYSTIHIKFSRSIQTPFLVENLSDQNLQYRFDTREDFL